MFFHLFILLFVSGSGSGEEDSSIQDVHKSQLEKLLDINNYTAVYWYARNCKRSEVILKDLETIDDEAEQSNIDFVKINDKRYGKTFGIKKFPALSFFRGRDIVVYEGNLKDEEEVLEFLTDEDNLAMPDKIMEVDAETMLSVIEQDDLVAVFFYDESKASAKALEYMENIDEETDVFNIRFLRIKDVELADDYSLASLPSLVYFRHEIPVVYNGELSDSAEVLEWLIMERSGADELDELEFVSGDQLDIMVQTVDQLLVLFLDNTRMSNKVFEIMETIDDDCDSLGVSFVVVRDRALAARYTIDEFPSLVYFEQEIPSVYDGDMENPKEVLVWVVDLITGADIEEVTNEILDKFIATKNYLSVIFFKEGEEKSMEALKVLEEIDDDLDELGIMMVKIDDEKEAAEYGIEDFPSIVVFENGIPNMYDGEIRAGEEVLDWIVGESSGDHTIESVTDSMLDALVRDYDHVAVVFYTKGDPASQEVLDSLEHIDDDAVNYEISIKLVRMDNEQEAEEYGIEQMPALVYFDKMIPNIYSGNLLDNQEILDWMTEQAKGSHIEEVTNEILDKLIHRHDDVTVLFYSKGIRGEERLVHDLEGVDHLLEDEGVPLVMIDDPAEADRWGLEVIPGIVHFQYKEPHIFKGDLTNEKKVVEWVLYTRAN